MACTSDAGLEDLQEEVRRRAWALERNRLSALWLGCQGVLKSEMIAKFSDPEWNISDGAIRGQATQFPQGG